MPLLNRLARKSSNFCAGWTNGVLSAESSGLGRSALLRLDLLGRPNVDGGDLDRGGEWIPIDSTPVMRFRAHPPQPSSRRCGRTATIGLLIVFGGSLVPLVLAPSGQAMPRKQSQTHRSAKPAHRRTAHTKKTHKRRHRLVPRLPTRRTSAVIASKAGPVGTTPLSASSAPIAASAVPVPSVPSPSLVFGIYPGGAAGTVGPAGPVAPEDPSRRLAALGALRAPGKPFVLHLYVSYTGANGASAEAQLGTEVSAYESAGFGIELVLCYRPADGGSAADVTDFTAFVRGAVAAFGASPRFIALQVTNEANVGGSPNASDGYYAGARDALIAGVIAGKDQARASGFTQIEVGFNWAYATDVGESAFWTALASGGARFIESVDWVGLDVYPGTWVPQINGDLAVGTQAAMEAALSELRQRYMPLAGLPSSVTLRIAENGYPTGAGRTEEMQSAALQSAVEAVNSVRGVYNVTDYRWFDLRDANSSSAGFESQYGLMTDDYSPKPAFSLYHNLIASLG